MPTFTIQGPYPIPLSANRKIGSKEVKKFWEGGDANQWKERRGCYVFGMRSGGGITPWYVGKTNATFGQEAFEAVDKLHKKYNKVLPLYDRGTPVMFFVVLDGAIPAPRAIDEAETFLIAKAFHANSELINICKLPKSYNWSMTGMIEPQQGKTSKEVRNPGRPTDAVRDFRCMLNIR